MLEQTVNTQVFGLNSSIFNKVKVVIVSCVAMVLSACVPMGNQEINTSLFKSKEDLQERASSLKPGMSKRAVFQQLSIEPEKFTTMSTQEVQLSIYGNSQVQGTPQQLEEFRQRLMAYDGYALPYRDIKSDGSLGFGTMKVNKNGYDLRLVLIFDRDRLMRASVDGNQQVNQDDNQYLWGQVLKKTTGIGF